MVKLVHNFPLVFCLLMGLGCSRSDFGERFANDAGFNKSSQSSYDGLLKKYVDEKGFVRYSQWKQSEEDEKALSSVVDGLLNTNLARLTETEKLAFYINAYNILTIDLILKNYEATLGGSESPYPEVRSIQNINNLENKVWDHFTWKLPHQFKGEDGLPEEVTLNQIEKSILYSFGDARIHFAINCASVGCPPLLDEPYSADKLEDQLRKAAYDFVNGGVHTVIDDSEPEFLVIETSLIMDWYAEDFENDKSEEYSNVQTFFARYIDAEKTGITSEDIMECLEFDENNECLFFKWEIFPSLEYDWTLNEAENSTKQKDGGHVSL